MYGNKLSDAVATATAMFRDRVRTNTTIPYITHLLQVMVWVGEHGGTEDQMVAAVMHDYLEDIEGASVEFLSEKYGANVAQMVVSMSDNLHGCGELAWYERKQIYLSSMAAKSPAVKLVVVADKLHNATCILRDYREIGDDVWARFTKGKNGVLWYYPSLIEALGAEWDHPMLDQLRQVVADLKREVE